MFGASKYGWQEICSFAKCAIIQLFIPFRQKGKRNTEVDATETTAIGCQNS